MPSVPREAATVMLLRDGPAGSGVQTWLMRRVPKMAFAAGMSVFPGGAVDEDDRLVGERLAAAYPAATTAVAAQFGTTAEHAGTLISAAIRETFEEVGVLLTSPPVVIDAADRLAVERRERRFSDMLAELIERGVTLDVEAIRPWARWVTPEVETRRYDTYFFVAALPSGLDAESVTTEASHADWIAVGDALAEFSEGSRPLMPPTLVCLRQLDECGAVAGVLASAAGRRIEAIRPALNRQATELAVDLGNGEAFSIPTELLSGKKRPGPSGASL